MTVVNTTKQLLSIVVIIPFFKKDTHAVPGLKYRLINRFHIVRNLMTEGGLLTGKKFIFISATRYNMTLHLPSDPSKIVVLPRLKFNVDDDGIKFTRTQFPVKVSFATSVNKCQGKTLHRVLIDLRYPFFAHGQLYVALSRVSGSSSIAFLAKTDENGVPITKVQNIVYQELIRI